LTTALPLQPEVGFNLMRFQLSRSAILILDSITVMATIKPNENAMRGMLVPEMLATDLAEYLVFSNLLL
jgi:hypothetical protein